MRDILPLLRHVTVRGMVDATGLTTGYCSMIRLGQNKGVVGYKVSGGWTEITMHWNSYPALRCQVGVKLRGWSIRRSGMRSMRRTVGPFVERRSMIASSCLLNAEVEKCLACRQGR